MTCDVCAVRDRGACGALSCNDLPRLNAIAWQRRFAPGQVILNEQERQSYVAVVVSGVVKLMKRLADGRQQIVGLALASDFLGRPHRLTSACSVEAATEVTLCTFGQAAYDGVIDDLDTLKDWHLDNALRELDAARDWILLLGSMTAEQRVASFLVWVARTEPCGRPAPADAPEGTIAVELPLTRSEMAEYLGLTLETVSRQMARLRQKGLISAGRGRALTIHDLRQLILLTTANDCGI